MRSRSARATSSSRSTRPGAWSRAARAPPTARSRSRSASTMPTSRRRAGTTLLQQHASSGLSRGTGPLERRFSRRSCAGSAIADVLEGFDSLIEWVLGFEVIPFDVLPAHRDAGTVRVAHRCTRRSTDSLLPRQTFTLSNIHEVERTIGLWQYADNQSGPDPRSRRLRGPRSRCAGAGRDRTARASLRCARPASGT